MSQATPSDSAATAGPGGSAGAAEASSEIDLSCRWPVMTLLGKGAAWLVIGLFLLLLASIKLHGPGMFADTAWLGLGRLKGAARSALVYGFATQFAFAASLWMLSRLGRLPLLNAPLLLVASLVWHVGVGVGVVGVLIGAGTGVAYLDMPRAAWPFLLVALGLIALWGLLNFHYRRERTVYVSQWFLVAALFWFPWVLSASVYLLVFDPVRGVMQAVVGAWCAHNLFYLWLTPVALAIAYYFVPKLTRQPLYSRQLAAMSFWTLAFLGGWGGMARLSGGPIPNWMISASVAANVLMTLPVGCALINLHKTMQGNLALARENVALRFILLSVVCLALSALLLAGTSFRGISQVTVFTLVPVLQDDLVVLGLFGMAALGAAYFIMPKVSGVEMPCAISTRWHWKLSVVGLGIYVLSMLGGGLLQGRVLNNPNIEMVRAIRSMLPWVGLSTLGLLVLLAGQAAFFLQVNMIWWRMLAPLRKFLCEHCCGGSVAPTKAEANS